MEKQWHMPESFTRELLLNTDYLSEAWLLLLDSVFFQILLSYAQHVLEQCLQRCRMWR
jgi:hypothetical protein